MKLMFLEKTILKMKFSKTFFLRGQLSKSIFLGINFENVFFERTILKMHFLRVPSVVRE